MLTGQWTGLCGKASSRFYSGSATLPKIEGANVTGDRRSGHSKKENLVSIQSVFIQQGVECKTFEGDKVAVLQALASTVNRVFYLERFKEAYRAWTEFVVIKPPDLYENLAKETSVSSQDSTAAPYAFQDDPYLIPTSSVESRSFLLAKKSGENAAKFIINSYPKYFQKDTAEPHIPCLMPEYFEPQIEGISEAALKERIKLKKVRASVDMFDQLLQAGTAVSLETSNSLLDLLCYYGDQEPSADNHFQQSEKSEELEEAIEENNEKSKKAGHQFGVTWRAKNNAERIFALMPEKNSHSYCTMIRGMVKHRALVQALNLYTELLNNRLHADVYTFNALIEATALSMNEKLEDKWNKILELLKEMAAQKVKPNLQTFNTILKCLRRFYSFGRLPALQTFREMKAIGIVKKNPSKGSSLIIYDIMNELKGKKFSPKDPDDAMRVCSVLRDLELAYQVHGLLNTGDNWKFIGPDHRRNFYYSKFFSLLCLMEQIDVTLKWYKDLIPSVFFPRSQTLIDLLQALDVANRLEVIPQIWKDSKEYGHSFRNALKEEILMLMARDRHPPELKINELLNEFMDSAKASNNPAQAIEIVKLASAFSLPVCEGLAQRVMADFAITQEQKEALGDLTSLTSDSDSDSDIGEGK
ncbi:pentatricopeptide repeat domain-containing protein 3 [Prionailurus iriomotensis]